MGTCMCSSRPQLDSSGLAHVHERRSGAAADCTGRRVASGRGAASADMGSAGSVARLGLRVRRSVGVRARVRI